MATNQLNIRDEELVRVSLEVRVDTLSYPLTDHSRKLGLMP